MPFSPCKIVIVRLSTMETRSASQYRLWKPMIARFESDLSTCNKWLSTVNSKFMVGDLHQTASLSLRLTFKARSLLSAFGAHILVYLTIVRTHRGKDYLGMLQRPSLGDSQGISDSRILSSSTSQSFTQYEYTLLPSSSFFSSFCSCV